MTRPVRWTRRAAEQLREAALYLEAARSGAGRSFIDQVEAILAAAAANPLLFPRVPHVPGNEVRRGLIRRYSYWVIYEMGPDDLLVLAVWHGSRTPEGWREG